MSLEMVGISSQFFFIIILTPLASKKSTRTLYLVIVQEKPCPVAGRKPVRFTCLACRDYADASRLAPAVPVPSEIAGSGIDSKHQPRVAIPATLLRRPRASQHPSPYPHPVQYLAPA